MDRTGFGCVLAAVLLLAFPGTARTQPAAEPTVHELDGDELTSESLIEVLQPQEEAPPQFRARGARKPTPNCDFYRRQRGQAANRAVAEIAAIKIQFAYDSADLTSEAIGKIDKLGQALTSSALAPCCFQIEGHTDNEGSGEYNRNLSERRARSVVDHLVKAFGIDRGRLTVVGLGESKPLADNGSEAGRSRNRRVQIVNLGYGEVVP